MDRRTLLKCLSVSATGAAFSFSFPSLRAAIASKEEPHWGYEGETGPELWSDLSPDFGVCTAGQQQSPINLEGGISSELAEVQVDYQEIPLRLIHNGHTVQVNIEPGDHHIILDNKKFDLLQFHFHHPSEHTLNGFHHTMEAHFVHRNSALGELAVLAVFMKEGSENQALKPVWDFLPTEEGPEEVIEDVIVPINQILPIDRSHYRYFGSLTTPPCSETVHWVVFQQPVEISTAQAQQFARVFSWNARPTQPINRRFVLQSS